MNQRTSPLASTLNISMRTVENSSPLFVGIFLSLFIVNSVFAISRTMAQILPLGVGHLGDDSWMAALWRLVSMVGGGLFLTISFMHAFALVVALERPNSVVSAYSKGFYSMYLALVPWAVLHIARLIGSIALREIRIQVDVLFLALYTIGGLVAWTIVRAIDRQARRKERA